MKFWALFLTLACSVLSWADCHTLDLSVAITKDFMVIGARGGFSPNIFYTTMTDQYGTRYVTLHRESEDDPGHIMWALYSEKNGTLDTVITDKNHKMYTAVGLGEGGKNPPSKKSFKYRGKGGVVAPLSALDEVAWNLAEFRKNAEDRADTNDILIMLETEANREDFLRKVRSYKPLVQSTKKMGFTFFTFGLLDDSDSRNDDWEKMAKDIYDAVGVEIPSQDELKKHSRCTCTPGAKMMGPPETPHSRGVIELLRNTEKKTPQ